MFYANFHVCYCTVTVETVVDDLVSVFTGLCCVISAIVTLISLPERHEIPRRPFVPIFQTMFKLSGTNASKSSFVWIRDSNWSIVNYRRSFTRPRLYSYRLTLFCTGLSTSIRASTVRYSSIKPLFARIYCPQCTSIRQSLWKYCKTRDISEHRGGQWMLCRWRS